MDQFKSDTWERTGSWFHDGEDDGPVDGLQRALSPATLIPLTQVKELQFHRYSHSRLKQTCSSEKKYNEYRICFLL